MQNNSGKVSHFVKYIKYGRIINIILRKCYNLRRIKLSYYSCITIYAHDLKLNQTFYYICQFCCAIYWCVFCSSCSFILHSKMARSVTVKIGKVRESLL